MSFLKRLSTNELQAKRLTVSEAARGYGLKAFDPALPLDWVRQCQSAGFQPVGQVVWSYERNRGFGEAFPLSLEAEQELKRIFPGAEIPPVLGASQRVVIAHPSNGVYLGSALGLGFWSQLDPAGQDSAVTFESVEDAESYMATWDSGRPEGVYCVPIMPDKGNYASMAACVAAGLQSWGDALEVERQLDVLHRAKAALPLAWQGQKQEYPREVETLLTQAIEARQGFRSTEGGQEDVLEALTQVRAALPDKSFARQYKIDPSLIDDLNSTIDRLEEQFENRPGPR